MVTGGYTLQEPARRHHTILERIRIRADVIACYRAGWSIKSSAALAGCGYATAHRLLVEAGIRRRSRSQACPTFAVTNEDGVHHERRRR